MKSFYLKIVVQAEDIDHAIKRAEEEILKEPDKLIMGEADDLNNEIWYHYKDLKTGWR
jgi:hypothetical protein